MPGPEARHLNPQPGTPAGSDLQTIRYTATESMFTATGRVHRCSDLILVQVGGLIACEPFLEGRPLANSQQAENRMCEAGRVRHHHASICIFLLLLRMWGASGHHKPTTQEILDLLQLQPSIPEGGYFAETFRDTSIFLPKSSLPAHCMQRTLPSSSLVVCGILMPGYVCWVVVYVISPNLK